MLRAGEELRKRCEWWVVKPLRVCKMLTWRQSKVTLEEKMWRKCVSRRLILTGFLHLSIHGFLIVQTLLICWVFPSSATTRLTSLCFCVKCLEKLLSGCDYQSFSSLCNLPVIFTINRLCSQMAKTNSDVFMLLLWSSFLMNHWTVTNQSASLFTCRTL